MTTRHFLLTNDDRIEEFSDEEAARVASGSDSLPRFADSRLRYVQVAFDENRDSQGELKVYTMGAIVGFDAQGRLTETQTPEAEQPSISSFEQDACVQFALRETVPDRYVIN